MKRLKRLAAAFAAVLKSFLGVRNNDTLLNANSAIKASFVGVKWSLYYCLDWAIFGFYGVVVGIMKHYGFSFVGIFLVLWASEIIIASLFLFFYQKTGEDITVGKNLRDAWNTVHAQSKIAGALTLIYLVGKLVFYDGSERALMFFMKETDTSKKIILLLVVISGTKMLSYTLLFSLGYDIFKD